MGLHNVISSLICLYWSRDKKVVFSGKFPFDISVNRLLHFGFIVGLYSSTIIRCQQCPHYLTTAVCRSSPHDSGHNYSSCRLISPDSRPLVGKRPQYIFYLLAEIKKNKKKKMHLYQFQARQSPCI